jgi:hypothetical protein
MYPCDGSSRLSLYWGLVCLGLLVMNFTTYFLQEGKARAFLKRPARKMAQTNCVYVQSDPVEGGRAVRSKAPIHVPAVLR